MEIWEFLLQKKGDKSWLPLESPTVEILEGQYRLAARSNFANFPIGIQLSYEPSSETDYKPTQQKISKRVSSEGLLIVLPYTNLTPGVWQISCVKSDRMPATGQATDPKAWAVRVQFDVLAVSPEMAAEWQLSPTDLRSEFVPPVLTLAPDLVKPSIDSASIDPVLSRLDLARQISQQRSEQLVESVFNEFSPFEPKVEPESLEPQLKLLRQPVQEKPLEESNIEPSDLGAIPANIPPTLISLSQAQFLVDRGQNVNIAGKAYVTGDLEIILKNPQDLEVLLHQRHSLPPVSNDSESIDFSHEIQLPQLFRSQVMIGEVRLYPTESLGLSEGNYVTRQAIAITCQMGDPIAEMSKIAEEVEAVLDPAPLPTPMPQPIPKKPSEALQLPPLRSNAQSNISKSTGSIPPIPLPVKLLTLPSLVRKNELPENLAETEVNQWIEQVTDLSDLFGEAELSQLLPEGASIQLDRIPDAQPEETEQAEDNLHYDFEDPSQLTKRSGNDNLNLSDRFLNKLQTLSQTSIEELQESEITTDPEILELQPPVELTDHPPSEFVSELEISPEPEIGTTAEKVIDLDDLDSELDHLMAQEQLVKRDIVVDEATVFDYPLKVNSARNPMASPVAKPVQPPINLPPQPVVAASRASSPFPSIDPNEPIPVPIVEIPAGELISGTPITASIRLPEIEPKLLVKLWVKDCQTRSIVDGPRWLMDFKSNGTQFVEAKTQITVPLGVIEVAFEAITVEMQTQRESHKDRVVRMVAPPNMAPPVSLNPSQGSNHGVDFDSVWDT